MEKSPLSALTAFDADLVENYVYRATGTYPELGVSALLKSWDENKSSLFNGPFDKKLRMTTHVTANLRDDCDFIKKSVTNASLGIVPSVADYMYGLEYSGKCDEDTVRKVLGLFNVKDVMLDEKVYDVELKLSSPCLNDTGKTKLILRGKRMRAIRKALEFVGYPSMELFTRFRDRVSLIRTTQKLDVDVTLSIHPIDFLSMSDNKSGWTSCMSLLGKGSCRSGVMEFMNSPTAVVAYVESDIPFLPGVPNKSWRMLLFYDESGRVAMGGRQYPFFSKALAEGAICKLTGTNPGLVCRYPRSAADRALLEEMENFDVRSSTIAYRELADRWDDNYEFNTEPLVAPFTYGACNDFFMFHEDDTFFVTYLDKRFFTQCSQVRLPMSGHPTCLLCGKELNRRAWGTNKVVCDECAKEVSKRDETGDSL